MKRMILAVGGAICIPLLILMIAGLSQAAGLHGRDSISIAGSYRFRLDPDDVGHEKKWFQRELSDHIFLPGTTDQAGYGQRVTEPPRGHLARRHTYQGPAWYQRTVSIPANWQNKRITLFLERCHWQTEVWVDGEYAGMCDSLSVPHVYDLTPHLCPGQHRLTICVDNRMKIPVGGWAHSVTDETQTNWNGIVGRMELRAADKIWIQSAQVHTDPDAGLLRVTARIGNSTGASATCSLSGWIYGPGQQSPPDAPHIATRTDIPAEGGEFVVSHALSEQIKPWDEWNGQLYHLVLSLTARSGGELMTDTRNVRFGIRKMGTMGPQFALNDRPIFLRGTLECCIFPQTGYPPMSPDRWRRIMAIARSYGLNHLRFHSWCPPRAAFVAADEAGFMLQVELPVWAGGVGRNPDLNQFMEKEAGRILIAYGNHPSFTMLSLGNELGGDAGYMEDLIGKLKRDDPRHLYTYASNGRQDRAGDHSDYFVDVTTDGNPPMRIHGPRFHGKPPGADYDFSRDVAFSDVPVVAHELGQWAVHPSFDEMRKYTGVLKPLNLEPYRAALAENGLLQQAHEFQRASAKFAWLIYKEDMETALRTPGYGGFQLLQLYDFPGQGEALVGLLDSFWESKGVIAPERFRRFCSPAVALIRLPKFVWTTDETLTATAQLANYGKHDLTASVGRWELCLLSIASGAGTRTIARGSFDPVSAPVGAVTDLGNIQVPLSSISAPAHLQLTLSVTDTAIVNNWDLWVYPSPADPQAKTATPGGILIKASLDTEARRSLQNGGTVVVFWPSGKTLGKRLVPMRFLPTFWSQGLFDQPSAHMGILCDPHHPALARFPTQSHCNYQWWELADNSQCFDLSGTSSQLQPIVQVIDDFHFGRKLAAVFEARVSEGKLLACSFDLRHDLDKRPAARQLRKSLLAYASSHLFTPRARLAIDQVADLLATIPQVPVVPQPKRTETALLDVEAAVKLPQKRQSFNWDRKYDRVNQQAHTVNYWFDGGGSWLDETGAAWHGAGFELRIKCPTDFAGTLYVHFHDWNELQRWGTVSFEDTEYVLQDHGGEGRWVGFAVHAEHSADGQLVLTGKALNGPNLMITRIVLTPGHAVRESQSGR